MTKDHPLKQNLIGKANESLVLLNGQEVDALVDSGSMITTVSESFYRSLPNKPTLQELQILLDISVADGSKLNYLGFIDAEISVPFLSDFSLSVPVLVVPDTRFNGQCPVIIGTNVIRPLKLKSVSTSGVPTEWQLAMDCLKVDSFTVKACSRKPITVDPYQTLMINGFTRNVDSSVSEVVTENVSGSSFAVCPRVIKLKQYDYCRVPVKVCNMTAKPMVIRPRSDLCQISEVKVVDSLASDSHPSDSSAKPSPLEELGVKIDKSSLSDDQFLRVQQVLGKWDHIFSKGPTDLGCTDLVKHKIVLTDDTPFKQPYRRIPPGMYEEVRQHLKEMLAAGAIRESESPYSSNIVLVRKKDNSLRFCLDYRTLNQRTRKDAYMLPRFDDTVDTLSGSKYFSKLDLRSGYWQVEMDEESKDKTAFSVGNLGFYECERLSFGLCNAPATFQRLMEKCMGELHLRECLIFIDDVLIFSKTFEEHLKRLEAVFGRLEQHNLKLKPSKCEFFKTSVVYLGHVVSEEGIATDPEKTAAVKDWKPPSNVKELRQFLGFAGYYRRFVKAYSSIAQPLNVLLEGHCTHKPKQKKKKGKSSKKPVEWVWGKEQQLAFDTLKDKLTNPPVLAYADYSLPFSVHTDACGKGLGAVLYQKQDGADRVIAYASRGLRPSERKYPAHKLEFLALKWALTDKFHDYLMGTKFEVITDSNPLTYVLTTAKLDATGHRWVSALANYEFMIKYRSGKQNTAADALSRLFPETIQAICQSVMAGIPLAESLLGDDIPHLASEDVLESGRFTRVDWQKEQGSDPDIARVIKLQSSTSRPREEAVRKESPVVQKFLREWKKLHLKDNVLYRTAALDGQTVEQLVIPSSFRSRAMSGVHDEVGHQGKEKTLWLAKQRFYWPGLERDIDAKVESCPRCIRRKTPTKPVAQLIPINSKQPMELVCMDFLSLERSKGGYENILVITDHFTRYAQAIPCRNQTAQTTAKALYENFIRYYSFPARLHSDQGRNFESRVIKELCKLAQTEKTRTTPYHPMGNGSAERFNQTLLKMLGTLDNSQKADWKSYVAPLVQAYNATKSDATGYSPHYLLFGWHPRLSVDAYLGTSPTEDEIASGSQTYGKKLKSRMQFAYDIAAKHAEKVGEKNKAIYDRGKQEATLEVGDRVLVRKVGLQGKQKLADRWEETSYTVCSIPNPSIPVYKVKQENGTKVRTLHRNLLLPFNCIPVDKTIPVPEGNTAPKSRVQKPAKAASGLEQELSSSDESSDSLVYVIPQRRQRTNRRKPTGSRSADLGHSPHESSHGDSVRLAPSTSQTPSESCERPELAQSELSSSLQPAAGPSNSSYPIVDDTGPGTAVSGTQTSVESRLSADTRTDTDPPDSIHHTMDSRSRDLSHETTVQSTPPGRPVRNRRPPDRYGEWVAPQIAWNWY